MRRKPQILVIDDDPTFGNIFRAKARHSGLDVDYFTDLHEALYCVPLLNYDLIVSDCMMPQIDGSDVTQYASSFLNIPVILVSASQDHELARTWQDLGAIAFVYKEAGLDNILHACQAAIGGMA